MAHNTPNRQGTSFAADDIDYENAALRAGIETDEVHASGKPGQNRTNPDTVPRFVLIDEFCKLPPSQSWTIRHYLEPDTLCVIYGESQAFKSFIVIDMICHVATGKPWRNQRTKQGFCLYIAGEGGNGLSRRFKGWFQHHGEAMQNVGISTVPCELCEPSNADALIDDVLAFLQTVPGGEATVIVLDTLSTHFGGGDENKTQDMRRFVHAIRRLRMATKATIIVIHHVGHGSKDRERGSISLPGDVDWRYRLERTPETNITTLFNKKSRDAGTPDPVSWNLVPVELPWVEEGDEEGQWVPMTSLVPVPVETQPEQPKPEYLPKAQRIAMDALRTALMQHGIEDKGVVSVAEDQWRQAAYDAGVSPSDKQDTRRRAFNRCRDELLEANKVRCHEGRFWIPKPTPTKPDKTRQSSDLSPGCREVDPDKTRHVSLDMSGYVGSTDNPNMDGYVPDFEANCGEERIGQRKTFLKPMFYSAASNGGMDAENPDFEGSETAIPPSSIIPPSYRERKDGGIERPLSFSSSLIPPNLDGGITAEWPNSPMDDDQDRLDGKGNGLSASLGGRP